MKNLKKFLLGTCVLSMFAVSTSAFAKEVDIKSPQLIATLSSGKEIELDLVRENFIQPRYQDNTKIVVQNGETAYFVNRATGKPFMLRGGEYVTFSVTHDHSCSFEYGLANSAGSSVGSSYHSASGTSTNNTMSVKVRVPSTGNYKFYVTNFSVDPLTITTIKSSSSLS